MRKLRLLGVALFALLAFGVFAASSAFAEGPELLGDEAALANESEVSSEGELELTDLNAPGGVSTVLCSGTLDGLWLAAEKKLDVESLLDLAGNLIGSLTSGVGLACTRLAGACTVAVPPDIFLFAVHLPWLLDLVLDTVGGVDLYLLEFLSSGAGQPGWELTCLVAGITITDECLGVEAHPTSADVQNMSPSDLLGIFSNAEIEESEALGTCSLGGAKAGHVVGEGLIFGPGGLALDVSG